MSFVRVFTWRFLLLTCALMLTLINLLTCNFPLTSSDPTSSEDDIFSLSFEPFTLSHPSDVRQSAALASEGGHDVEVKEIPRKIWTFWDGGPKSKIPEMIRAMTRGWAFHNPSYQVTILGPSTISKHIRMPLPPHFWDSSTTRQQRANWIRLAVLVEQGGFWIDASTILTGSLDTIRNRQKELKSEAFAYNLDWFSLNKSIPVYETYFLASVPQGKWLTAWFAEYNTVFSNFRCADEYLTYLQKLYGEEGYNRIAQNINDPSYLKLTIASQRVLSYGLLDGNVPLPDTERAESVPYRLLEASGYDDWVYARNLLAAANDTLEIPMPVPLPTTALATTSSAVLSTAPTATAIYTRAPPVTISSASMAKSRDSIARTLTETGFPTVTRTTARATGTAKKTTLEDVGEVLVYKLRLFTRQALEETIKNRTSIAASSLFARYVLPFK
ncbi:hypothetical protein HDU67_006378 [Dinochytrium kinnereticum]|nr:hypothetical protein HDU67_006378 [Dinochytrium kinnereticum]